MSEEFLYSQGTPASAVDFDAEAPTPILGTKIATCGIPAARFAREYPYGLPALERCPDCRLPASLSLDGCDLDLAVLVHAAHRLVSHHAEEIA